MEWGSLRERLRRLVGDLAPPYLPLEVAGYHPDLVDYLVEVSREFHFEGRRWVASPRYVEEWEYVVSEGIPLVFLGGDHPLVYMDQSDGALYEVDPSSGDGHMKRSSHNLRSYVEIAIIEMEIAQRYGKFRRA